MRLTLRTLLAYRDGVLSPAETSDLHQRIKQNQFASDLLRRIENLVKDQKLATPKVKGQGLGGDANSVAEYLDDSLSSEQVPEFERICIADSDLVLAELAHCHQLLAEAMNSQVVVSSRLTALAISLTSLQSRADLYRRLNIGSTKASTSAGPAASIRRENDPPAVMSAVPSEAQVSEVTASQRSQVQAPMVTSGGGSIRPQGLDLERPQLAHEVPEYLVGRRSGGWRIPLAIGAMLALLCVIVWQALGPLENVRDLFLTREVVSSDSVSNGISDNTLEPTAGVTKSTAPVDKVSTGHANAESVPSENEVGDTSKAATNNPDSQIPIAEEFPPHPSVNLTPESSGVEDAFRWVPGSDETQSVLFVLKSVDGKATPNRLAANEPIPAGVEIVVPPYMRTTLDFASQCSWTVCGPTLMELTQNGSVTIRTSLCRALAKAGRLGRKLTIAAPTGSVELQFEDATSMAAIEVAYRPVSHGTITDKMAFKPLLIVVAVEGQVTLTPLHEAGVNKGIRLVVGGGVAFTDDEPTEFELGAIPAWYRAGNERPLDSLAAADMHKFIDGTGEVNTQLAAMSVDSRPETAALAIQAKMLLGDWSDFAGNLLSNEMMRSHWLTVLALAEQLIASKDQNPDALKAAFEAFHPGRGDELFALLIGATVGTSPKESLLKLVESLGSSELGERILAAHQLRRLTGKDLGFQPSFPNRAVLQQWRRVITSNPALLTIDSPLWEAKRSEPAW